MLNGPATYGGTSARITSTDPFATPSTQPRGHRIATDIDAVLTQARSIAEFATALAARVSGTEPTGSDAKPLGVPVQNGLLATYTFGIEQISDALNAINYQLNRIANDVGM